MSCSSLKLEFWMVSCSPLRNPCPFHLVYVAFQVTMLICNKAIRRTKAWRVTNWRFLESSLKITHTTFVTLPLGRNQFIEHPWPKRKLRNKVLLCNQGEETDLVRTVYSIVGKWKIFQKIVEKSKFQKMELNTKAPQAWNHLGRKKSWPLGVCTLSSSAY